MEPPRDLISSALAALSDNRTIAFQRVAPPDPSAFAIRVSRVDGRKIYATRLDGGGGDEIELIPLSSGSVIEGDIGAAFGAGGIYRGIFRGRR